MTTKNLSYILNGVLAILLIVMYIILKNDIKELGSKVDKNNTSASKSGNTRVTGSGDAAALNDSTGMSDLTLSDEALALQESTSWPTTNIVYVNIDSLLLGYTMYKQVIPPLEQKIQATDQEYNKLLQALQEEYAAEAQAYSQGLRTSKAMEEVAQRLDQKKQELDLKFQAQADNLSNQYTVAMEKVENSIRKYLRTLAQSKGYQYVSDGSLFWYSNQKNNITSETLKVLNAQYSKN